MIKGIKLNYDLFELFRYGTAVYNRWLVVFGSSFLSWANHFLIRTKRLHSSFKRVLLSFFSVQRRNVELNQASLHHSEETLEFMKDETRNINWKPIFRMVYPWILVSAMALCATVNGAMALSLIASTNAASFYGKLHTSFSDW